MNEFVTLQTTPTRFEPKRRRAPWQIIDSGRQHLVPQIEHSQFQTMVRAFSQRGGLASTDDVIGRLRMRSDQPISVLARWMVERAIVNFAWQSRTLVPLFQFDLRDMSLRAGAVGAISELTGVFDDWELALWFVQANVWLHNAAPIDRIEDDEGAVLEAASADRFIARG